MKKELDDLTQALRNRPLKMWRPKDRSMTVLVPEVIVYPLLRFRQKFGPSCQYIKSVRFLRGWEVDIRKVDNNGDHHWTEGTSN